jgi:hypothetical protein
MLYISHIQGGSDRNMLLPDFPRPRCVECKQSGPSLDLLLLGPDRYCCEESVSSPAGTCPFLVDMTVKVVYIYLVVTR